MRLEGVDREALRTKLARKPRAVCLRRRLVYAWHPAEAAPKISDLEAIRRWGAMMLPCADPTSPPLDEVERGVTVLL